MRLFDNTTTIGNASTRVEILGISIPLPFAAAPDETFVIPAEDDPATLARLEAIMSDSVRTCRRCGRETHICEAIGCDIDDAPLLAALTA
jgi:hypothetical protein